MNIRNYVLINLIVILIISGCVEERHYLTGNGMNDGINQTNYVFDKSKFCPEHGDCSDYGLESRKCDKIGDCIASCHYGCVSKKWIKDKIDCESVWPNFDCECIAGICQKKDVKTKETKIPFETVDDAGDVGRLDDKFIIILDKADLYRFHGLENTDCFFLYRGIGGELKKTFATQSGIDLSKIDFDKYFIIIAIHPTQHIDINITKINQNKNILILNGETKPDSILKDKEAWHYHIIKIKKSDLQQRGNLTFVFVDQKGNELHRKTVEIL